jgi:hypothetical protein
MAEDHEFVQYQDISDLKRELEGIQEKKEVSAKDLHEAVRKLTETMGNMLGVFAASAEQLKLEEKEYQSENREHEAIISKLDKIIDQNKTIAEGMVAIVELVKEKFPQKEKEESMFSPEGTAPAFAMPEPKPEPRLFMKQEFKPAPQSAPGAMHTMQPMSSPSFAQQDFGLPPMEPAPMPDLDLPDEPFPGEEPKKKRLFGGMFKK